MNDAIVEISDLSNDYRGLRPLRVRELTVRSGDVVALVGFDQAAAEVFVNLLTGATVPDRGTIRVFGRPTSEIADAAEWLAFVDRFGIVSDRAVLLDPMTVEQNLAMPFTLEIEPPPAEIRVRAAALARETGLPEQSWQQRVLEIDGELRTRVRLARALALDPALLLLEHASASIDPRSSARLAADIRAVAERRGIALLSIGADEAFARSIAPTVLALDPASGRLAPPRRRWF